MKINVISMIATVLLTSSSYASVDNFLAYRLTEPVVLNDYTYDSISFDASFGLGYTSLSGALLTSHGVSLPFSGSCLATAVQTFFCSLNIWHYTGFLNIKASDLSASIVIHNFEGVRLGGSQLTLTTVK